MIMDGVDAESNSIGSLEEEFNKKSDCSFDEAYIGKQPSPIVSPRSPGKGGLDNDVVVEMARLCGCTNLQSHIHRVSYLGAMYHLLV